MYSPAFVALRELARVRQLSVSLAEEDTFSHPDTAPVRDIVQEIQMSTGALIKPVDRETSRLPPGQQVGSQKARKEYYFQVSGNAAQVERAKDEIERNFKNVSTGVHSSLPVQVLILILGLCTLTFVLTQKL